MDRMYNLAAHSNLQITLNTPSKWVLYWSSRHEREMLAASLANKVGAMQAEGKPTPPG